MQKYIGSDITSMVTLPVIIFEPMTMLQKMAEVSTVCKFSSFFLVATCKDFYKHFLHAVNGVFLFAGSSR